MADVPTYDASAVLAADIDRALHVSLVVLAAAGFRLVGKTASSAELTTVRSLGWRQDPLLGASRLRVSFQEGRISVAAELGGLASFNRFVHTVPLALVLVLGLTLGVIFTATLDGEQAAAARTATLAVLLGQVVLWTLVAAVVARRIESRTRQAIDTFVTNVRDIVADG